MQILKRVLAPVLVGMLIACQQESVPREPQNAILGKWALIQSDDIIVETTDYIEFLPDSLLNYRSLNEGPFFSQNKYAIKDSTLYIGLFTQGKFSGNAYYYEFSSKGNKLRLRPNYGETTFINITAIPVTVFQRIK